MCEKLSIKVIVWFSLEQKGEIGDVVMRTRVCENFSSFLRLLFNGSEKIIIGSLADEGKNNGNGFLLFIFFTIVKKSDPIFYWFERLISQRVFRYKYKNSILIINFLRCLIRIVQK